MGLNIRRWCGGLLLGLWLGGAPVWAASPSPPQATASDSGGWRPCAAEGANCTVQRPTTVRYGATGRWVFRQVSGEVVCGNALFGDPAPGVAKRCEARVGSAWHSPRGPGAGPNPAGVAGAGAGAGDPNWVFCAAEGELCRFIGHAEVRFGEGRAFRLRMAENSVVCNVDAFGDPAYGTTKYCEVAASSALPTDAAPVGGYADWEASSGWRHCAAEGQSCRVSAAGGRAQVRFGDGRDWSEPRMSSGSVACDVRTFGDPAYGRVKHCEVAAEAAGPARPYAWRKCADEGGACSFKGRKQVRFGTDGRYAYRDGFDGMRCELATFDIDPYPQRRKVCEIVP